MNWSKAAEAWLAEHCSPGKGCEPMIKITIIRQQRSFAGRKEVQETRKIIHSECVDKLQQMGSSRQECTH